MSALSPACSTVIPQMLPSWSRSRSVFSSRSRVWDTSTDLNSICSVSVSWKERIFMAEKSGQKRRYARPNPVANR